MTVRKFVTAPPGGWQRRDKDGPRSAMSRAMRDLVDFVARKGPVTRRDVAIRFGLRMDGAESRLDAGVRLGVLVRVDAEGDEFAKWACASEEAA